MVHHATKSAKAPTPTKLKKSKQSDPLNRLVNSLVPYSTKKIFDEKIRRETKTYVVFGADWCAPCVKLKKLLWDAGVSKKVVFLNSSKPWVAEILIELGYPGIPYTVVYSSGKPTGEIRVGLSQSLMFLIVKIDTD